MFYVGNVALILDSGKFPEIALNSNTLFLKYFVLIDQFSQLTAKITVKSINSLTAKSKNHSLTAKCNSAYSYFTIL